MNLDHNSDIRDIAVWTNAQHARDAMGRYADIRSGSMYRGDDRPTLTGLRVIIFAFAAVAGAVLGILTAPDVAVMPSGPGHETCTTKGC